MNSQLKQSDLTISQREFETRNLQKPLSEMSFGEYQTMINVQVKKDKRAKKQVQQSNLKL